MDHNSKDGKPISGGLRDAILVTLRGQSLGLRTILSPDTPVVLIGRDPDAGVPLTDESTSRHHCRLELTEIGWFIEDLKSTNGTYVGYHAVDRAALRDGDFIKVGSTIFKFLAADNIEASYHEELHRLAIIDGLTQVHNRRYLDEFIEREISRCRRHDRPMTLLMLDVDAFKQANAQFGHLSGDHILRTIGAKLGRRVRREELLARYGGDEFSIVLPETELEDALKFAEIIRHTVEVMEFKFDGWKIPVTVSIGAGRYQPNMNLPEDLIAAADAALYRAKSKGRNKVSD